MNGAAIVFIASSIDGQPQDDISVANYLITQNPAVVFLSRANFLLLAGEQSRTPDEWGTFLRSIIDVSDAVFVPEGAEHDPMIEYAESWQIDIVDSVWDLALIIEDIRQEIQ